MTAGPENAISERAQHFLKVLIERYIRMASPVRFAHAGQGRRTRSEPGDDPQRDGRPRGPGTFDLAAHLGGRYRPCPVTGCLSIPVVAETARQSMLRQVQQQLDIRDAPSGPARFGVAAAVHLTHLAGVVMVPKHNQVRIRQIEFVPLSEERVLTIVTSTGEVYNRSSETRKVFSRSELEQLSNYITSHYAGTIWRGYPPPCCARCRRPSATSTP